MRTTRKLNATDVQYHIICAGSKFDVGVNRNVTVKCCEKTYAAKMHSTTKGRIDGLAELYKDHETPPQVFQVGTELELTFEESTGVINIAVLSQDTFSSVGNDHEDDHKKNDTGSGNQMKDNRRPEDGIRCSKSDDGLASYFLDPKEADEKSTDERLRMAKIIGERCDGVVRHSEYYYGSYYGSQKMAVNRSVIMTYESECATFYEEDGNKIATIKCPLGLKEHEYEEFLGFNRFGIWFGISGNRRDWTGDQNVIDRIVCFDVHNNQLDEYYTKAKNGIVRDIYIDDSSIVFVSEISENKQTLNYVDMREADPETLFTAQKNQSISSVSLCNPKLMGAFYLSDGGNYGWKVFGILDGAVSYVRDIIVPKTPEGRDQFTIQRVDLKNGVVFTDLTREEEEFYHIPRKDNLICWGIRKLEMDDYGEVSAVGRMLTYKKDGSPAIFQGIPSSWSHVKYFDANDCYSSPHYTLLERYDRNGNRFFVGDTGHGVADRVLVSDKYIYVNYDAYDLVRLPRKFSTSEGRAENNPEAMFFFGKGVDYRM